MAELRGKGYNGNDYSKRKYATSDYYFFRPTSLTLILEGYISPEIMVPYLEDESGYFYGVVGTPTKMKDLRGGTAVRWRHSGII